MPAQNCLAETTTPPPSPPPLLEEEKANDLLQGCENQSQEQAEKDSDSEGSLYSSGGETHEFIVVNLDDIRKEVQCPICLGIIRKTRTVMECLHRFCRECIDKSMRLGNNECPACRTHCASRRSLRDDPNYDALIATLYPDIDKYEEQELAWHEEEKVRNKQFQASFAQTFRRQTEASGKKRRSVRASNYRSLRLRRNYRVLEHQGSDDEEVANERDSNDSSSAEERSPEVKSKGSKRWTRTRKSQADDDNDSEPNRELLGVSSGFGGKQVRAWGQGGMRSNNRHSGLGWANDKVLRNNRILKLTDTLRCSNEDNEAFKITLTLVSLHGEKIPSLNRPYISCDPASSVRHICQYVAMRTSTEATAIEILMIKNYNPVSTSPSSEPDLVIVNPSHNELQLLNDHQTVGDIHASFTQQNLVLGYRLKGQD